MRPIRVSLLTEEICGSGGKDTEVRMFKDGSFSPMSWTGPMTLLSPLSKVPTGVGIGESICLICWLTAFDLSSFHICLHLVIEVKIHTFLTCEYSCSPIDGSLIPQRWSFQPPDKNVSNLPVGVRLSILYIYWNDIV